MQETLFQQAFESSTEALCVLCQDNTICYVNPAWEALTEYSKEQSIGKILPMLWSDKTNLRVYQELEGCMKDHTAFDSEEVVHRTKSGREYNVSIALYPVTAADGEVPYMVVTQRDITERKVSELSKSEFISLATHQLRTPLTSVIWNLEILMDTDITKMTQEQLSSLLQGAHKSAKRMAETIGTLLQLSNLEIGKTEPNFTYAELPNLFEIVRAEQLSAYIKRNQTVTIECPPELTLYTDPNLLKEILSNLLNNAIKYTPVKGQITFKSTQDNQWITIEVQDTGYGIPNAQKKRVFSKFFRGENVLFIESTGNGLGLYLVSQLVQLLRGTIAFSSDENKGTTFIIKLPLDARSQTASGADDFVRPTA